MSDSNLSDDDLVAHWELITRAVARTQSRVLVGIENTGLPSQWFAVLHLLLRSSEHRLPMSRMARELAITTGGFTKMADRMGQAGLIDRRNSSGDRRVVYAALTEEGLRLARRSERQYKAALREHVLGILTEARLVALADNSRTLDEAHADAPEDTRVHAAVAERSPGLPDRRRRPARGPAEGSAAAQRRRPEPSPN